MDEWIVTTTPEELADVPEAFLRLCTDTGSVSETLLAARLGLIAARRAGMRQARLLLPCHDVYEFVSASSAIRRLADARGLFVTIGAHITTPNAACACDKLTGADFLLFDAESLVCKLYHISQESLYGARYLYPPAGARAFSPVCTFDSLGLGTLLLISARRLHGRALPCHLHGRPALAPDGAVFCQENGFAQTVLRAASSTFVPRHAAIG